MTADPLFHQLEIPLANRGESIYDGTKDAQATTPSIEAKFHQTVSGGWSRDFTPNRFFRTESLVVFGV
ncbi:MAG: hypothetical protein ACE5F6_21285, partial [Anaerolineae bacterium]